MDGNIFIMKIYCLGGWLYNCFLHILYQQLNESLVANSDLF